MTDPLQSSVSIPQGPRRRRIEDRSLGALRSAILDQPRRRPLYFDGRFLAARDLTREQEYFLDRQSSLGRALGSGVIQGLEVERVGPDVSDRLRIGAGHGLTPGGELVALADERVVDLSDIPAAHRLNAAFGLRRRPQPPLRNRSGLFVVALRPVEFSANPVASYPTSIDGQRSAEDGDVVEATAITLVPYPDPAAIDAQGRRRARVAREIFVDGITPGLPAGVLPLAMVELERGQLVWLDPFMVRRELGREPRDVLDLGLTPASLRRAAVLQYDFHLREVLRERVRSGRGARFAAAEHFLALPPVGPMPLAAVDPTNFSQHYFPAEVETELTVVPEDEIPALLEAGLHLPPIDLTLESRRQESTQVLLLVPLTRDQYRPLRARIVAAESAIGEPASGEAALPARPGALALARPLPFRPRPLDLLRDLGRPRVTPPQRSSELDSAWRQALEAAAERDDSALWFVRRRNVQPQAALVGTPVEVFEDRPAASGELQERLRVLGLRSRFGQLRDNSMIAALPALEGFLGSEGVDSRLFFVGAIAELEFAAESVGLPLTRDQVTAVQRRFLQAEAQEGHARLREAHPDLTTRRRLADPMAEAQRATEMARIAGVAELDRLQRLVANYGEIVERFQNEEERLHQEIRNLVDRASVELGL